MSRLGPLTFGKKEEQIFLGREIAQHRDFSEETARQIDAEVRSMVDEAYKSAYSILDSKQDAMHRMAVALLERETLDANEIRMIIDGQQLPPVKLQGPPNGTPTGDAQPVMKPEPKHGSGFPEGSPSPA
jgi:cell division protease FtsH